MRSILEKSSDLGSLVKTYRTLVHLRKRGLVRGATFVEAGFVYAPYIPLQVTPILCESNDT